MTPIERAARALAVELAKQEGYDVSPEQIELDANLVLAYIDQNCVNMGDLARAVLLALREPSHDMTAPVVAVGEDRTEVVRIYQAMIDAALEEG